MKNTESTPVTSEFGWEFFVNKTVENIPDKKSPSELLNLSEFTCLHKCIRTGGSEACIFDKDSSKCWIFSSWILKYDFGPGFKTMIKGKQIYIWKAD